MHHHLIPSRRFRLVFVPIAVVALALFTFIQAAFAAPGVDPATVDKTVNPGDSFSLTKTVHTPIFPPKPDVIFLADTTGSMGAPIANVQAGVGAIMTTVQGAQPGAEFGAAQYKDTADFCPTDPFAFNLDQSLTLSLPAVQTAVNTWTANPGDGCDLPEAQINALFQLATSPSVGFRSDSSRIIVWFGDATGHDPSGGHSLSDAIAALQAAHIEVIAVPVIGSDPTFLDEDGQATAITGATGGQLMPSATAGQVADAILAGLSNLPVTVTTNIVCDAGLTLTLTPIGPTTVTSGQDVSFTEDVTVDPGNPGGSTLHCTVEFFLNDQLQDGFTESVNVTVNGADLAVLKTGPALVTEGHNFTYHLVATNNGPATATNVSVSDPLPANTTFVSASPGCTQLAGVVTCTVASLASGASASFDITVTAGSAGSSIVNTATVGGNQSDPNPGNNSSTVTTVLNHNPVCTNVTGGPDLWPPNHKFNTITLTGATDPDGDPVSFTITGVTQDEPLNGLGDGDTSPDAELFSPSGAKVQLRAERSGTGDGRVYRIAFTVSDGRGGMCTGVATVGVPHDQGQHSVPIDSGLVVNSLF